MMLSERIQWLIHKLEVGGGSRWLRGLTLAVVAVALAGVYDIRADRDFASPEAMDAAQVARQLAAGHGFSTDFIRPFSLYLVQEHKRGALPDADLSTNSMAVAQVNGPHPDLANPPAYPALLAGWLKLWPPEWKVQLNKRFWSEAGFFLRYQPEFRIAVLNQFLLLVVVALTFLLAIKLFDETAAWLSSLLVLVSGLLWKFSVAGLSTMLLLVFFLGLAWCLVKFEERGRNPSANAGGLLAFAAAAGLLTGAGMLTRYSFGWLILPVAIFVGFAGGRRRMAMVTLTLATFAVVVAPWIARNLAVSGTPFGTAGYALLEGTYIFPGSTLMQSLNPDLAISHGIRPYTHKFSENLASLLQGDLLHLAGGWLGCLFFAGLLLGLRNVSARRLRLFTLLCLVVFAIVEALGKTSLSDASPDLNTENLFVLLTPLVTIFGVGFFLTLLDQMLLPTRQIRYAIMSGLVLLAGQPLATIVMNKNSPVAYPPYFPPEIQTLAGYMQPDELMMSDVPWAVAWYGQRQCVWLTLDAQDQFYAVGKTIKPVQALYLTSLTMDGRFVSEWMKGSPHSWGNFIYVALRDKRLPDDFPLTKMPAGLFPERLFLSDRDRWSAP
jgi:hypothetical protein